ncbi:MAG: hypothetical protein IRY99_09020 [Isosphaeraceae bacterium]|nr:hypothetical protein [Isosphaeraceae bacterium]
MVQVQEDWPALVERLRGLARERAAAGEGEGEEAGTWALCERLLACMAEPERAAEDPLWKAVRAVAESGPATGVETPLEVTDLRLCRRVRGFGDFDPIESEALRPGQAVVLYWELAGVRAEPDGDHFRSRLSARIEILPAEGDEPLWSQSLGAGEDHCRRRRHDYYLNAALHLPASLSAGSYRLRLTQMDTLAGCSASRAIPLMIQP